MCASCSEAVHLQTPEQGEPERMRSGLGALALPLLLLPQLLVLFGSGAAATLALPSWVYVALFSLVVWVTAHKLLNPAITLTPTGLEMRKGLRSFYVRYADVVESRPGLMGTWRLREHRDDSRPRTFSFALYELRKADRARVRAVLEGLPGKAAKGPTVEPPSVAKSKSAPSA